LPLLEQVERSEAVRLFVARAAAAVHGFALIDKSASTVARICHQLDGLPLAIELAAERMSALGPEQLGARLADRFRLLTDGSRTALPRHQTLRATLERSYALLDEPERRLFERLTVSAGGWTLEAAEAGVRMMRLPQRMYLTC
jgi:predicted ATPase